MWESQTNPKVRWRYKVKWTWGTQWRICKKVLRLQKKRNIPYEWGVGKQTQWFLTALFIKDIKDVFIWFCNQSKITNTSREQKKMNGKAVFFCVWRDSHSVWLHIHYVRDITPTVSVITPTIIMTSHPLYLTLHPLYLEQHNQHICDHTHCIDHISCTIFMTSYPVYMTSHPPYMTSHTLF